MNGNPLGASICTRSFGEPKEHLRSRRNSLDSFRNRHLAGYGDLKNEFRVAEFVINLEGSSRRVGVATIFGICVRDHSTCDHGLPNAVPAYGHEYAQFVEQQKCTLRSITTGLRESS